MQRVLGSAVAFLTNTNQSFVGTILASTQVTLTSGITLNGRAFANTANVTFINDTVNVPSCAAAAPRTGALLRRRHLVQPDRRTEPGRALQHAVSSPPTSIP